MGDLNSRSASVDRLVEYLLDGVAAQPGEELDGELGRWLSASSRFRTFSEAHRDKIRRKLRGASG